MVGKFDSSNDEIKVTPLQESPAQNSDDTPSNDLVVEPNATTSDVAASDVETPIEITIPPNLESPGKAKNLKIVTIEPKLSFTPEQTLIANLRTKVAQLSQDYPAELVDSIEVDLTHNSLFVKVTDRWYELDESDQNTISNEMLQRSRQYNFQQLKLLDSSGILVARNPVIGREIVILEREQPQLLD